MQLGSRTQALLPPRDSNFDTLEHCRPQATELRTISHFLTTAYYTTNNNVLSFYPITILL